jgi:hypothetical protein
LRVASRNLPAHSESGRQIKVKRQGGLLRLSGNLSGKSSQITGATNCATRPMLRAAPRWKSCDRNSSLLTFDSSRPIPIRRGSRRWPESRSRTPPDAASTKLFACSRGGEFRWARWASCEASSLLLSCRASSRVSSAREACSPRHRRCSVTLAEFCATSLASTRAPVCRFLPSLRGAVPARTTDGLFRCPSLVRPAR